MRTVELLSSIADVPAAEWDGLVARTGASVFYRHQFLRAYEDAKLGGQHGVGYLTERGAGAELASAVPVYLLDAREILGILGAPVPAWAASRALLSHAPHCYDTSVPSRAGSTGDIDRVWAAVVAEGRRVGARLCGFFNVPRPGPLATVLDEVAGVPPVPGGSRWYLDVAQYQDLDAFLATMARATRRTLRAANRRSVVAGAVVRIARGPRQDLDDVVELCASTAAKHGNNYYPPAAMRRFLAALDDRLVTVRVRRNGVTLAASVCLHDGDVLHCWAGGARYPDELNWSPNHVLFHAELSLAFRLHVTRLECGRRNDEFKARHRLRSLPLVGYFQEL